MSREVARGMALAALLASGCSSFPRGTPDAGTADGGFDAASDAGSDGGAMNDNGAARDADVSAVTDAADGGVTDVVAADGDVPAVPVDAGPMEIRGGFVSAGVSGAGGGYTLRGVVNWHTAVRGTGGGYTLEGWLR